MPWTIAAARGGRRAARARPGSGRRSGSSSGRSRRAGAGSPRSRRARGRARPRARPPARRGRRSSRSAGGSASRRSASPPRRARAARRTRARRPCRRASRRGRRSAPAHAVRTTPGAPRRSICEHLFVPGRRPSCTRIWMRSSRRSSSATSRGCAAGPSSSVAGSFSQRATRRRPAASAQRWAAARRGASARRRSSSRPRFSAYLEASRAVFRVFDDISPLVEGLSIDEAFLDVRGMERASGTPAEIAERLRREVRERVGLPITVGVARTKFLAKVASGVAKPDGLLVVPPDRELAFLHALAGRAALGRRAGDGAQASGQRDRHRRRGRRVPEARAGLDAGQRVGPAAPRARAQPRSATRPGRAPAWVDRVAAGARPCALVARDRSTRTWSPSSTG